MATALAEGRHSPRHQPPQIEGPKSSASGPPPSVVYAGPCGGSLAARVAEANASPSTPSALALLAGLAVGLAVVAAAELPIEVVRPIVVLFKVEVPHAARHRVSTESVAAVEDGLAARLVGPRLGDANGSGLVGAEDHGWWWI